MRAVNPSGAGGSALQTALRECLPELVAVCCARGVGDRAEYIIDRVVRMAVLKKVHPCCLSVWLQACVTRESCRVRRARLYRGARIFDRAIALTLASGSAAQRLHLEHAIALVRIRSRAALVARFSSREGGPRPRGDRATWRALRLLGRVARREVESASPAGQVLWHGVLVSALAIARRGVSSPTAHRRLALLR